MLQTKSGRARRLKIESLEQRHFLGADLQISVDAYELGEAGDLATRYMRVCNNGDETAEGGGRNLLLKTICELCAPVALLLRRSLTSMQMA